MIKKNGEEQMSNFLIQVAVVVLRFINLFFKPFTLKDKVVIISRQSDEPTLDIRLLNDCLKAQGVETVVLTKTLQKSLPGIVAYAAQMLKQMYYLAVSKVVILDGYCILVSVLPKKKAQKVIQMWHALGAIKKFGWQNVENPDGHSASVAKAMKMHRNYDYVLAPGRITGAYFAEAFHVSADQVRYYGLPRIDFIREDDLPARKCMETAYPVIKEKKCVLYVPTFRKHAELELEKLISEFDFKAYALVLKKHFLDQGDYGWAESRGVIVDQRYSSMEWLKVCDKVITDYSAIAFEAAVRGCELYIYQPDLKQYDTNVGLNVDLSREAIGTYVGVSEKELVGKLREPYQQRALTAFREKYMEVDLDHCTQKLCRFIQTLLAE